MAIEYDYELINSKMARSSSWEVHNERIIIFNGATEMLTSD